MSSSFLGSTLSRNASENFRVHGQISLTDNTVPLDEDDTGEAGTGDDRDGDSLSSPRRTYSKRLRDEYSNYKYRRYQETNYAKRTLPPHLQTRPPLSNRPSTQRSRGSVTRLHDVDEEPNTLRATPTTPEILSTATTRTAPVVSKAAATKQSRLRRGQRRVRDLLHRKKYRAVEEGDTEVDILWENQRGWFFFGIPHFSGKTLLQFDPKPWLNADMRPSPVTTSTAQCPDPTWQWQWKNWYVDIHDNVDENGWQYSFMFQNRFAWHGTHNWFQSFVRRRRWVRMRVRKTALPGQHDASGSMKAGHRLNADYFTIHPARPGSVAGSMAQSSTAYRLASMMDEEDEEEEDIDDIASLLAKLRVAKVDRDKINLVLRYMDQGLDTYCLADEMHEILGLFVFQHSRRRLLSLMNQKINAALAHRDEHEKRNEPEFQNEKRKIDNLARAREAADKELQALEYWSDIKHNVNKGLTSMAVDESEWDHGWAGLDNSGPGRAGRPDDDTEEVLDETNKIKARPQRSDAPALGVQVE